MEINARERHKLLGVSMLRRLCVGRTLSSLSRTKLTLTYISGVRALTQTQPLLEEQGKVEALVECMTHLGEQDPLRKEALVYILWHLKNVAHFSDKNLMHTHNLSIVFGPTLMRHDDPMSFAAQSRVIKVLLEKEEVLGPCPKWLDWKRKSSKTASLKGVCIQGTPKIAQVPKIPQVPKIALSRESTDTADIEKTGKTGKTGKATDNSGISGVQVPSLGRLGLGAPGSSGSMPLRTPRTVFSRLIGGFLNGRTSQKAALSAKVCKLLQSADTRDRLREHLLTRTQPDTLVDLFFGMAQSLASLSATHEKCAKK